MEIGELARGGEGVPQNLRIPDFISDIKGLNLYSSPHRSPLELWLASKTLPPGCNIQGAFASKILAFRAMSPVVGQRTRMCPMDRFERLGVNAKRFEMRSTANRDLQANIRGRPHLR